MATTDWQPTTFLRYVRTVDSSSRTALIQTDAGATYLKAINNPEGPHVLACDWFGTELARRFGLSTFDVGVMEIDDLDEIPLNGSLAHSGTAFVSRAEDGVTMGGQRALSNVENIGDIPRLVVFDTWMRNCDRHAPNWKPEGNNEQRLDSSKGILLHSSFCARSRARGGRQHWSGSILPRQRIPQNADGDRQ